MASLAAAARDIPQASQGRDNFTVVATGNEHGLVTRSQPLPTPPNSISPALPAHGLKAQLRKAKLEPIDSDLDLHAGPSDCDRSVSPHHLESSGAITSNLLGKYHLPEILLDHGPLAIRHIMGYLTTSVPGFAAIPPTKARRLVVGALEGRGAESCDSQAGVVYEKVGWGRWDAKRRGLEFRAREQPQPFDRQLGIPISRATDRSRIHREAFSNRDHMHFSHEDREISLLEDAADNMSMDGSASASCSEAPDEDDIAMRDDPEDATDDEDWATVGAAALRAESYPNMTAAQIGSLGRTGFCSYTASTGMARPPMANIDLSMLAEASDAQEREAVEALLRLGSV